MAGHDVSPSRTGPAFPAPLISRTDTLRFFRRGFWGPLPHFPNAARLPAKTGRRTDERSVIRRFVSKQRGLRAPPSFVELRRTDRPSHPCGLDDRYEPQIQPSANDDVGIGRRATSIGRRPCPLRAAGGFWR